MLKIQKKWTGSENFLGKMEIQHQIYTFMLQVRFASFKVFCLVKVFFVNSFFFTFLLKSLVFFISQMKIYNSFSTKIMNDEGFS